MSRAATSNEGKVEPGDEARATNSDHTLLSQEPVYSPTPPGPPLPTSALPQSAQTPLRNSQHAHHSRQSSSTNRPNNGNDNDNESKDPRFSTSPAPTRPGKDWAGSAIKRLRRERHVKNKLSRLDNKGNDNKNNKDPETDDSAYETADDGSSQYLQKKISHRNLVLGGERVSRLGLADEGGGKRLRARASLPVMNAGKRGGEEDLFVELGNEGAKPGSRRGEGRESRLSMLQGKRQSLPGGGEGMGVGRDGQRPKSSGTVLDASSRVEQRFPAELGRHADRFRESRFGSVGSVISGAARDGEGSVSGRSVSGRTVQRHSSLRERLGSPEVPQYGRRRPSFGAASQKQHPGHHTQNSARHASSQSESPVDDSEPKHESNSVEDSQTESSGVWDELDELKSRIKQLELGGKRPLTSGAAVSGGSSERPRTATTAPTTIDSSPKQERKPETKQAENENAVGGPGMGGVHPNLHSALAKAKTLLNPSLYRSLETTAADAIQLAAMTGSAGPQGTTFSAASIINGVTVSDRHVRRKADNMCRSLTDLCLALCDGKHESAGSVTASPLHLENPMSRATPPSRLSTRNSIGPNSHERHSGSNNRPMSRLEARRSSILGPNNSSLPNSPRDFENYADSSEREHTPSGPPRGSSIPHHMYDTSRRASASGSSGPRASSSMLRSRLSAARAHYGDNHDHYNSNNNDDDAATDADDREDHTIRAPSRAMTEIGGLRSSKRGSLLLSHKRSDATMDESYHNSSSGGGLPQRSPSLRSSFSVRRGNQAAYDNNARVSSFGGEKEVGSGFGSRRRSLFQQQQQQQQERERGTPPPPLLSSPAGAVGVVEEEQEADEDVGALRGEKEHGKGDGGEVGNGGGNRTRRRIASLGPFAVGGGGRRIGSLT